MPPRAPSPGPPARRPHSPQRHGGPVQGGGGAGRADRSSGHRGSGTAGGDLDLDGDRDGGGRGRAWAEAGTRPRRGFPLPRGRRRGREGRRWPRYLNPFGAPGPPSPRPRADPSAPRRAAITHFPGVAPEPRERPEPPRITRPEREWPSQDFGAHEGHSRPQGRGFPRGASLGSPAPLDSCGPGPHPPPTSPGARGPAISLRPRPAFFWVGEAEADRASFRPSVSLCPLP